LDKKSRKNKSHFNRQEKAILKILYEERRGMSIKELSEKSHMSWVTAKKYIDRLIKKDWIEEKK